MNWRERTIGPLLAVLILPLDPQGGWRVLKFRNIPANEVEFSQKQMVVKVKASASPIVRPFPSPIRVQAIEVHGHYEPRLILPPTLTQGEKGADDFAFRLGLVVKGKRTLNWLQAKMVPAWVKELHALAEPGTGIDHIEFLNVVEDPKLVGRTRTHPKSDLLRENFLSTPMANGDFTLVHKWATPLEVVAIWLASDGDDTKSQFSVQIREIRLSY